MMRLLVTRPEADADETRAALVAAGHCVMVEPLMRVEPVAGADVRLDGVQALVATSRNALRVFAAGGPLGRALGLPLVAVGPGTAALGRELGFARVIEGLAGARDLPSLIASAMSPADGALLHLAGETLAFNLAGALRAQGFEVRVETVYRTVPVAELSPALRTAVATGQLDGVLLMSPATAETYAGLVRLHGLAAGTQRLVHFCMSGSVARRLDALPGIRVEIALRPNAQEMLALVARVAAQLN